MNSSMGINSKLSSFKYYETSLYNRIKNARLKNDRNSKLFQRPSENVMSWLI